MYFGRSELSYDTLVTFVIGLDMGTESSLLDGFREFLILKLDDGNSLVWPALVPHLILDDVRHPLGEAQEQAVTEGLFDLLDEFLAEVNDPRRRRRLHHEYTIWLQSRSWYNLDLERFHTSAPAPMLSAEEAMTVLGVRRLALNDLIAAYKLHPARVGAALLFREDEVSTLAAERQQARQTLVEQGE
jgi:hypothetical protein